jgi:hypothetical protein
MPQTAAGHEARVNLMKSLAQRFPDVAWKICVSQFGDHHGVVTTATNRAGALTVMALVRHSRRGGRSKSNEQ